MNKPEPTDLNDLYDQLDEILGQLGYSLQYRQEVLDNLAPGELKTLCARRLRHLKEADKAIELAMEMIANAF